MSPRTLFRGVALAEAVTWALLLGGMVLKYVTDTTELGVRVFGPVHGVVFIAYCLVALLVSVDQRWSAGRLALGLLCAVPPFATVWFDRRVAARDGLGAHWRLAGAEPQRALDRPVARLLRHPLQAVLAGLVAVAALTGVALLLGPPTG